jgi:thioredoxin reductase (NADPH)
MTPNFRNRQRAEDFQMPEPHIRAMLPPPDPLVATRHDQIFPILEAAEIGRITRLGERRTYATGAHIFTTGEIAPGAFVLLSGHVDITQRSGYRDARLLVTHGPGSFMGEISQLAGRPALVDGVASEPVETLVIPPRRLRDLLVEEAELGERIMRALILRRVLLLRNGAGGPVIIGSADHGDVLRLEGFLNRNGHPHQRLDPEVDTCAGALIERFHVTRRELPIVLCPTNAA